MSEVSNSPPGEGNLGPCLWTIPPAEDAPRGVKSTTCGEPGVAEVRIREKINRSTVITDAKVVLCATHKAVHDDRAKNVRLGKTK